VYFQLVASPDAVPAAVAVTLPVWGLSAAVAVWLVRRAARAVPAIHAPVPSGRPLWSARWARAIGAVVVWTGTAVLVGIPLAGLVAKAGADGHLFARLAQVAGAGRIEGGAHGPAGDADGHRLRRQAHLDPLGSRHAPPSRT
jgi:hypothetical protein